MMQIILPLLSGFYKRKYFLSIVFAFGLICFQTILPAAAIAQQREFKPDQFRAINWTTDDGLSLGEHIVLKDSKGFTWVGAFMGPLLRFDGARFEKYVADPDKPGSILSEGINSLVEDSLKNIWIGTMRGLSRYDIQADTFTNFITAVDSENTGRGSVAILSTPNDLIVLESNFRIVEYNLRTLEKKKLFSFTKTEMNALTQINPAVYEPASNSLWFPEAGNGDSLHPGGGLIQVSLDDGRRKHYGWDCYRHIPNHGHDAEAMRFDAKRNSIWINSPDGLVEFSFRDRSFHFAAAFNEFINVKDYGRFVGIDIDNAGRVWLATHPKGVLIYDPETNNITQLFSTPDSQKKTGENNMWIYCTRDGIVWLTYWDNRGIYELLPYTPSVTLYPGTQDAKDSLGNGGITTIVPADHDKIWIGTSQGINILNSVTGKFEQLKPGDLPGIKAENILPLYIDTIQQKAWMASVPQGLLYEMNIATQTCRKIIFRDGSRQFDTLNIEGNLIQPYDKGLLIYDLNHGFFEIKKDSLFADMIIPLHDFVGRIELVEDSLLFLKNPNFPYNYSYEKQNGKWMKTANPLDSVDWNTLFYDDRDHMFWACLDNKLVQYNKNFTKIKAYGKEDGYTSIVFRMMKDKAGNLWYVNQEKQIGRVNAKTGIISTLSPADGYQPQFYDWFTPGAKDIEGNLYFGQSGLGIGKVGLIRIYPEKYISPSPSTVYFSTLKINYKNFPLSTGVNNIQELTLPYDQNSISIETGIIDYYSIGKSHMRYKLEGDRKTADWQYGPSYFTIRYDGLSPGNYRLVLQGSNASNEFIGPEKLLLIHINPPWWQTWWARLLLGLTFAFVIWSFVQYRSRNLRQKNVVLEEKVMHRTKELKLSLEELRGAQNQLIQREKMASLGELTAGIAHEIQNPLNFVNNFSDLNSELIEELKTEQKKETRDFQNEGQLLNDIEQNEQKINHHGRRADAIVKGMLLHSRTSAGQKEPTDINALTDEYLRLSYHGLRAKEKSFNATILTDFDPGIGEIKVIPQDIGRVLLNLFNNAFYSVNEKKNQLQNAYEPTVSVATKRLDDKVEIRVRDNGIGIPQKVLDKIYQPFFTTKPPGEGTGLGLSLSYDIITKIHGGELKAETREAEFAEFIILLPI
jgi:signal transduction histidine kinase/ligand-binding sensor domain-containing protein